MFEDENFEIDTEEDAFRLINPVVAKMKEAKAAAKKSSASESESESGDEEIIAGRRGGCTHSHTLNIPFIYQCGLCHLKCSKPDQNKQSDWSDFIG